MSHLIDDKFVTPCSTTIVARHFQSIKEDVAMYRRHTAPYRQLNKKAVHSSKFEKGELKANTL